MQYSNVFLGFSGLFLIIMQNDILLLHMLKIKGEIFELQVLQQFAATQNLMFKLQMIVWNELEFFASICVCGLELYLIDFIPYDKVTDFIQL